MKRSSKNADPLAAINKVLVHRPRGSKSYTCTQETGTGNLFTQILHGFLHLSLLTFFFHTDQRIHLFLKCCLVLGVQRSLLDLPGGLTLIEAELAELGQKFVSLTHHNQQVFGPYYTEILKGLLPPAQVLETEVASL